MAVTISDFEVQVDSVGGSLSKAKVVATPPHLIDIAGGASVSLCDEAGAHLDSMQEGATTDVYESTHSVTVGEKYCCCVSALVQNDEFSACTTAVSTRGVSSDSGMRPQSAQTRKTGKSAKKAARKKPAAARKKSKSAPKKGRSGKKQGKRR